jgi:hypothetical protein
VNQANAKPTWHATNGPQSMLERILISDYLLAKGYLMSELDQLPEPEAKKLMNEACLYATLKMAEIEARAKFQQKIAAPDLK